LRRTISTRKCKASSVAAKDETRRHETDLARYGDIFEGSKVIEKLTDETAPQAKEITFRLRDVGYTRAISIVGSELTRQLAERQRRLESGEISQVGVNAFLGEIGLTPAPRDLVDRFPA
jgi:methylmalonyl-CoA mutase N-terminal domain/subunit